ncbi:MAG: DUF1295 domain-containing protein [Clostridiales bacterium]|nr:DUF1295 domain-containing protein [Clostridiales bacterium]
MEKIKKSRAASFVCIALIYVVASAFGAAVYLALPFHFAVSLLIADAAATVVVFVFSLIFKNASVYDPYWSVQPMVILGLFAAENGLTAVTLLPLIAVFIWGVRLTANWAYSFKGLDRQDWRYELLKQRTGKFYPLINFIGIHMVPTVIVWACTLPAVLLFKQETKFNFGCVVFFLVSMLAAGLQLVSDVQMHRFHARGLRGIMDEGLWKYARHPNYLGEILMWWGVGLYAVCVMPERWYLLAGALANTALFLTVSIPMMEERQSKKPGWDEYKRSTRLLLLIKKGK